MLREKKAHTVLILSPLFLSPIQSLQAHRKLDTEDLHHAWLYPIRQIASTSIPFQSSQEQPNPDPFHRSIRATLTLTPASGLSSQQSTLDDAAVAEIVPTPSEEVNTEAHVEEPAAVETSESKAEPIETEEANAPVAASVEPEVEAPTAEIDEEVTAPEPTAIVADPLATPADSLPATTSSEVPIESAEETQEVLTDIEKPVEKAVPALKSKRSIIRKEPPIFNPVELVEEEVKATACADETKAAAPPVLQVDGITSGAEPVKEVSVPEAKEGKPKKKRFVMPALKSFSSHNSQDGNTTDDSVNAKAKKDQPIAGMFKNVLGRVKSVAKRDKHSDKAPKETPSLNDNAASSDALVASEASAVSGEVTPSEEPDASAIVAPVVVAASSDPAVTA
ncbi:hypothetical protein PSTT_03643 [Puccinia striiformis]|uniref:Uncharacterized protein n=1 Tax=Puccinia striiformis TaxID=27350 RepID=A0A2S4VVF2_9BASI|nr:hypothetical protein PSTT_03643 [Puccinia striiformis]